MSGTRAFARSISRSVGRMASLCLALAIAGGGPARPADARLRAPASAVAEAAFDGGEPRVRAQLVLEADVARPGVALRAGVLFELDPGWHLYWKNSGQSGIPTELRLASRDARISELQWPAPEVFLEADGFITTYGYRDEVLLFAELVFADGTRGTREIAATADFLVCEVECIPGRVELRREVRVGDAVAVPGDEARALFDRFAARVPAEAADLGVELEVVYGQSAVRPGDRFEVVIGAVSCLAQPDDCRPYTAPSAALSAFVPEAIPGIELEVVDLAPHPRSENGFLVQIAGRASPDPADGDARLRGVLTLHGADGAMRGVAVDVPLPRAPAGAEIAMLADPGSALHSGFAGASPGLLHAILLGLLGGLLLNLMPCVLPVLAIKIVSLAELAHRDRRDVWAHAAAYAVGVLASMLALAAVVAGLRAVGGAVGWGFQFQEPVFVAVLGTVLVVFALNLFGVFEIHLDAGRLGGVGAGAAGARRSLFDGLLAVVLATPCTAPFLGTAVGFAFASSTPVLVAIFAAIGVGLAAPFALAALVPGMARLIPRPGAWMLVLRGALGFALLGTAVWLLWIVGRAAGSDALVALLAFLVGVGFAVWAFGLLQRAGRPGAARAAGAAFAALGLVALVGLARGPLDAGAAPAVARNPGDGRARAYDRAAIDAELSRGRTVFAYFTADWCITCKMNERTVLSDERVRDALETLDVAVFEADWTRRDDAIRAELARFGKAGVPLYLVYGPSEPGRPRLLPEILSVDRVLRALREAAPGAHQST